MKVCIVHVDDESDEPRQVSERIALDGLPHFFRQPIRDGTFTASEGGSGNATICWYFGQDYFHIDYLKCTSEKEIDGVNIGDYEQTVFVFDVHRENEYGSGQLLIESIRSAQGKLQGKPLRAIIWTNFPNSDAVRDSGLPVRLKQNVAEFAIELMRMLGFTVHE